MFLQPSLAGGDSYTTIAEIALKLGISELKNTSITNMVKYISGIFNFILLLHIRPHVKLYSYFITFIYVKKWMNILFISSRK